MDSRAVNKEINRLARPVLREWGFGRQTGRRFFRDVGDSVDLIQFSSMNSYIASGVGCTTYSFGVELGCWFASFPSQHPPTTDKNDLVAPHDYDCALRYVLKKGISQPFFHPYRDVGSTRIIDRVDVWYVTEDGGNTIECVEDVIEQLDSQAVPWFEWCHDPVRLRDHFKAGAAAFYRREHEPRKPAEQREPTFRDGVEIGGDVGPFVPHNSYTMGAWAALEAGDFETATSCLERMSENEYLEEEARILSSRLPPSS